VSASREPPSAIPGEPSEGAITERKRASELASIKRRAHWSLARHGRTRRRGRARSSGWQFHAAFEPSEEWRPGGGAYAIRALPGVSYAAGSTAAGAFLAGHLVLQRKRADCGIASPVITALCGQNANRQSEHERGGSDDYAFGHHGSPLGFWVQVACIAVDSTAACDGRHKLGEYGELTPKADNSRLSR